jgi:hypothetical protein
LALMTRSAASSFSSLISNCLVMRFFRANAGDCGMVMRCSASLGIPWENSEIKIQLQRTYYTWGPYSRAQGFAQDCWSANIFFNQIHYLVVKITTFFHFP